MNDGYLLLEKLGPLPDESEEIGDGVLERYENLFKSLGVPKDINEAKILLHSFPESSCFGLQWELLHRLEKTPGWPIMEIIKSCPSGEWRSTILARANKVRKPG